MERVRLPLEYTVRQSGARGRPISHFYWWEDRGMPSSPVRRRRDFIKWSRPGRMPQLTRELLHLLYLRRESRLRHYRRPSGTDRLTKDSGISCRAVCFSASFNRTGYLDLHVVHRLLRAASPALSCRCRAIQTLFQTAGEIFTRILSRSWCKKHCKKRACPNPHGKCSELVCPFNLTHRVRSPLLIS